MSAIRGAMGRGSAQENCTRGEGGEGTRGEQSAKIDTKQEEERTLSFYLSTRCPRLPLSDSLLCVIRVNYQPDQGSGPSTALHTLCPC